jgi:RNA polymerase sigma-70 factor, ECF subfamily
MSDSAINPTPVSLLAQLRQPDSFQVSAAWRRFVQLYTPLLLRWARRVGARAEDAADLVQDVFTVLAQKMPTFEYDAGKRFRGWLWTVLLNKWRDRVIQREGQPNLTAAEMETLAVKDNVEEATEQEYQAYLIAQALKIMKAELPPKVYQACLEYMINGRPAAEVARELGMSVNQVYAIKSRILRRLRAELEGLLA